MLDATQWAVLAQIEVALKTMAFFERILEGENYVAGSLVPLAIFQHLPHPQVIHVRAQVEGNP